MNKLDLISDYYIDKVDERDLIYHFFNKMPWQSTAELSLRKWMQSALRSEEPEPKPEITPIVMTQFGIITKIYISQLFVTIKDMLAETEQLKKKIEKKQLMFAELNQENYCHFCKQYVMEDMRGICDLCAKQKRDEQCDCDEFLFGTYEAGVIGIECSCEDRIEIPYGSLYQYHETEMPRNVNTVVNFMNTKKFLIRTNNLSYRTCVLLQIHVAKIWQSVSAYHAAIKRYYVGLCETLSV